MKSFPYCLGLLLLTGLSLTAFRAKPKWITLFDGKSISGWHSYHKTGVVGWSVEEGTLTPDGTGGDLVTDAEYGDFDLEFDFKLPPGSNSGVVYKVIDSPDIKSTFMSGPEYQLIDDKGYLDNNGKPYPLKDTQLTGANYDMMPPADKEVAKAPGTWSKGRIVVEKNHVTHYLNGKKLVEYDYGTPDWQAMVAKSKFASFPYATPHARGKIALQNHSPKERVWFRNIRIREL